MPGIRTDITEITTGLATLGFRTLGAALAEQPAELLNVGSTTWNRLRDVYRSGNYREEFSAAWENGRVFLHARCGLRGRRPARIEWKGPHRNPGYDFIPADLRIDHVYLISCKYRSSLLMNASPSFLFDRMLADRSGRQGDWYWEVASQQYQALYERVRAAVPGCEELPSDLRDLSSQGRQLLKSSLRREWPSELLGEYVAFSHAVAKASARRWSDSLTTAARREEMLWRLLRLAPAPYFVLGASTGGHLRLRVQTPWDWRQQFRLRTLRISPDLHAKQPQVRWEATVLDKAEQIDSSLKGHVEIRWGHGRFSGNPEAKVYLDTPHSRVPGYVSLD